MRSISRVHHIIDFFQFGTVLPRHIPGRKFMNYGGVLVHDQINVVWVSCVGPSSSSKNKEQILIHFLRYSCSQFFGFSFTGGDQVPCIPERNLWAIQMKVGKTSYVFGLPPRG